MDKEKVRYILLKSELFYTAGKLIDSESFDMMIDELVEKLSDDTNDLEILEKLMKKYEGKAILKEQDGTESPNYYHGVVDGINKSYRVITGVEND